MTLSASYFICSRRSSSICNSNGIADEVVDNNNNSNSNTVLREDANESFHQHHDSSSIYPRRRRRCSAFHTYKKTTSSVVPFVMITTLLLVGVVTNSFVAGEPEDAREARLRLKQELRDKLRQKNKTYLSSEKLRDYQKRLRGHEKVYLRTRIDGLTPYEKQQVVTYREVMEMFPQAFEANLEKTQQMADEHSQAMYSHDSSITPPPPPYLSMGYAKAGSTTINSFFQCMGYKGCHYFVGEHLEAGPTEQIATCFQKAKLQFLPLLESCGYPHKCQSYAQMESTFEGLVPQLEHLNNLLREEPKATLILPFRNFESWIQSQHMWSRQHSIGSDGIKLRDSNCPFPGLNAFDAVQSYQGGAKLHADIFHHRQELQQMKFYRLLGGKGIASAEHAQIFRAIEKLRGEDDLARLALFWVYHVTYVRNFAQSHPQTTLIEFNLEDPNTADYLAQIFHLRGTGCWRHVNSTPGSTATTTSYQSSSSSSYHSYHSSTTTVDEKA